MGRRVDPGFWARRALPGPRQQPRSRAEKGKGRGGRQSLRKAPAYLGSPGPGIDHAPVSAQRRARGAHVPCRARRASGTCGTHRAPTRSRRAAAAPGPVAATAPRRGPGSAGGSGRGGPAGSETHRARLSRRRPLHCNAARLIDSSSRRTPPASPAPLWVPDSSSSH